MYKNSTVRSSIRHLPTYLPTYLSTYLGSVHPEAGNVKDEMPIGIIDWWRNFAPKRFVNEICCFRLSCLRVDHLLMPLKIDHALGPTTLPTYILVGSVIRWLDDLSNFWPFTTMKICQISLKICPKTRWINPQKISEDI